MKIKMTSRDYLTHRAPQSPVYSRSVMLLHVFLFVFCFLTIVNTDGAQCSDFFSDANHFRIKNDFSGWFKTEVRIWTIAETKEEIQIIPKTNAGSLSSAEYIEYEIEYPKNLPSASVRSIILNGNVICSTELGDKDGRGTNLTVETLLTIKQARLNSDECGVKREPNSFFPDAPKPPEAPWLVAFYSSINGSYSYACAGNLITDRHVLSVAQCFAGGLKHEQFAVVMGVSSLRNWAKSAVVCGVTKWTIHEEYAPPVDANIALVTLDRPVTFTEKLKPICLLGSELDHGVFAGWGSSELGKDLIKVRQLALPVVKQEDCSRLDPVYYVLTSNRTFCAGDRRSPPPCTGDIGGGLATHLFSRRKWSLRGLYLTIPVKSGECNRDGYAIFADVAKFSAWIVQQTQ